MKKIQKATILIDQFSFIELVLEEIPCYFDEKRRNQRTLVYDAEYSKITIDTADYIVEGQNGSVFSYKDENS